MKLPLLIAFTLYSIVSFAQLKVYNFEQVDSLQKQEKKSVVIFFHTDWCRYCKMMETSTFKSDSIIDKLNNHFYFISFNPEEKTTVTFAGHKFSYQPTKGVNEIAEHLATIDGKISYPTIAVLNSAYEIVFQQNQFISSTTLNHILSQLLSTKNQ